MKTKVLLILFLATLTGVLQAATVQVTGSLNWSDLPAISSGDTLEITGTLTVDKTNSNSLQNTLVYIVVDGGELNFDGSANQPRNLYLGAGSSIQLLNGGLITAYTSGTDVYQNASGTKQIYFDGNLTASGSGDNAGSSSTTLENDIPSFYAINNFGGLDGSGLALPVELIAFDAVEIDANTIGLQWVTASEENNSHFVLEYSIDGSVWNTADQIQSLAPGGNSVEIINYSYEHNLPEAGKMVYYRIKQVDYNGMFEYSDVLPLNRTLIKPVKIASFDDHSITVINNSENNINSVTIYNSTGELISTHNEGTNARIQVAHSGVYFIEVTLDGQKQIIKHFIR